MIEKRWKYSLFYAHRLATNIPSAQFDENQFNQTQAGFNNLVKCDQTLQEEENNIFDQDITWVKKIPESEKLRVYSKQLIVKPK